VLESRRSRRLESYIGKVDYGRACTPNKYSRANCAAPTATDRSSSTLPLPYNVVEALDAEAATAPIRVRMLGAWSRSSDIVMTVIGTIGFVLVTGALIVAVLLTGDTKPRVVIVDPAPTPPAISTARPPTSAPPKTPSSEPIPTPGLLAQRCPPPPWPPPPPPPTSSPSPSARPGLFPRLFPRHRLPLLSPPP
jgi:hypothetical protein